MSSNELPPFTKMIDLASEKLGGEVLSSSDDFFASMHNLIKPSTPVFIDGKYTENGKWMDGWESRRKRTEGHDWCVIKLGATGVIHGVDVNTAHFLGNHPPKCSIEAAHIKDDDLAEVSWTEILPKSALDPGSNHFLRIDSDEQWSHIKLHIYPDGGVARLRVYGEVKKNWDGISEQEEIDLSAALNGAKCIWCNDMFFSHMDNLIMPDKGVNMGDGWETKRNRTPGNRDQLVVRLARKGSINKILVDTAYFKGNYPDSCLLEGAVINDSIDLQDQQWSTILPQTKLEADKEHFFEAEIANQGPFTHVRLTILPDGGISRLRVWGNIQK